jgi:isocitrate lyase
VINMGAIGEHAALLQQEWETSPRWAGITRGYNAQDVIRLRGCVAGKHSVARRGATRLWDLLHGQDAVRALGAAAGNHAVQVVAAEPHVIYLPGWQAADGNQAGPGGPPAAFGLMAAMIEAGAAGVHFDDQVSPDTKRAHLGGKVLIPTGEHIQMLTAARLAADVLDVPALVIARTGARTASLLTSDTDERDHEFLTGERTADGFHRVKPGLYACVRRGLAFAPYADLLWLETLAPDLAEARAFADIIHSQYPGKLLAYSCPAPFSSRVHLDDPSIAKFRKELAAMGYRFQVTTLAGFHAPGESTSEPADRGAQSDAAAYSQLQEAEFALEPSGYTATRP